jgi:hypothetical protein
MPYVQHLPPDIGAIIRSKGGGNEISIKNQPLIIEGMSKRESDDVGRRMAAILADWNVVALAHEASNAV